MSDGMNDPFEEWWTPGSSGDKTIEAAAKYGGQHAWDHQQLKLNNALIVIAEKDREIRELQEALKVRMNWLGCHKCGKTVGTGERHKEDCDFHKTEKAVGIPRSINDLTRDYDQEES